MIDGVHIAVSIQLFFACLATVGGFAVARYGWRLLANLGTPIGTRQGPRYRDGFMSFLRRAWLDFCGGILFGVAFIWEIFQLNRKVMENGNEKN